MRRPSNERVYHDTSQSSYTDDDDDGRGHGGTE